MCRDELRSLLQTLAEDTKAEIDLLSRQIADAPGSSRASRDRSYSQSSPRRTIPQSARKTQQIPVQSSQTWFTQLRRYLSISLGSHLYLLSDGLIEFFLPHLSYPDCAVDCVCRYRLRSTAQRIRETVVHSFH